MAKRGGATRKGAHAEKEVPEYVETERHKELEALAEQEQAEWGDEVKPLEPGDEDDIPPEARVEKPGGKEGEDAGSDGEEKEGGGEGEGGKDDKGAEDGKDDDAQDEGQDGEEKKDEEGGASDDDFDTLVVDGVETKTERSKIYETGKQALQKTLFADKKMQEATDKAKEADRILTEARQKAEELAKPADPDKGKTEHKDTGTPLSDEDVSEIIDNIRYGNPEQSKEAVLKLATLGAKATPPESQDVTPIIDQRFDELYDKRTEIQAFESALDQAKRPPEQGGFGDVFDGGPREKVFEYFEGKIAQEEPTLSYSERFAKAGEAARQTFAPTPTKQGSPESDSRSQRKAELENSTTATSPGSAKPKPQPAKSEFDHHNQLLSEIQKDRRGR